MPVASPSARRTLAALREDQTDCENINIERLFTRNYKNQTAVELPFPEHDWSFSSQSGFCDFTCIGYKKYDFFLTVYSGQDINPRMY